MSHNQAMENRQDTQKDFTEESVRAKDGVVISSREAAEYCEYKKQRKRADIRIAMLKSEGVLRDNGEAK